MTNINYNIIHRACRVSQEATHPNIVQLNYYIILIRLLCLSFFALKYPYLALAPLRFASTTHPIQVSVPPPRIAINHHHHHHEIASNIK